MKSFLRLKVPYWLYAFLFFVIDGMSVIIVQMGVQRAGRVEMTSAMSGGRWGLITKTWKELNFVIVLSALVVAMIYGLILLISNRFWISSAIILSVSLLIAVIEYMKVNVRYETILPADLNFLKSNTGNVASFLPDNAPMVIGVALGVFILLLVTTVCLHIFDTNHGKIVRFKDWRYSAGIRVAIALILIGNLSWYIGGVGTVDSSANVFSKMLGDSPAMWDSVYDAQRNGAIVAFLRNVNPKIMDRPADYSEETMKAVYKRYNDEAKRINRSRTTNMNDNTFILILSESFSDPTRVPGLKLNKNPIPFISNLKKHTDSGLMLSSGYGGGTANLEYMSLTGLSMANFDPSMTSPYQQLVPNAQWSPTINQYWDDSRNSIKSIAFHPYEPSLYLRATNYKKFGFSKFYALQGPDVIAHRDVIDKSPYVSDASAYKSALEKIKEHKQPRFVQIVTMQNHMPYRDWYANNEFEVSSKDGAADLGDDEKTSIETYAKGVQHTDEATQAFLKSLDKLNKPITVMFYGDHLPGIYGTASSDEKNSLSLHLTDYFIWSNKVALERKERSEKKSSNKNVEHSNTSKDVDRTNKYSSPNFFISQAALHMNAKVSPYLAFLTCLHEHVSAMEPPVVNTIQGWDRIPEGQSIYLDNDGNPMILSKMDKKSRQLLHDYRLIQYDITAGKHYLRNTDFLKLPR